MKITNDYASQLIHVCAFYSPHEALKLGERKSAPITKSVNTLSPLTSQSALMRQGRPGSTAVHTAWDMGWGDLVSIWMFQSAPFEWRFVDYIEGNNRDVTSFVRELQAKPYVWGTDYLPWDAASTGKLATGKSVEAVMRGLGRKVHVVPQNLVHVGIEAVRRMLPLCWFDIDKCSDGIQALRHYRYGEIKVLSTSEHKTPTRTPLHDWASHPSDALRTAAMGVQGAGSGTKPQTAQYSPVNYGSDAWMA